MLAEPSAVPTPVSPERSSQPHTSHLGSVYSFVIKHEDKLGAQDEELLDRLLCDDELLMDDDELLWDELLLWDDELLLCDDELLSEELLWDELEELLGIGISGPLSRNGLRNSYGFRVLCSLRRI